MWWAVLLVTAASRPRAPGGPSSAHADSVEPLDFAAALKAAHTAVERGESADVAMDRVFAGDTSSFEPAGAGRQLALDWVHEREEALLQHEIITSRGWSEGDTADARHLGPLRAPLPPWAQALADRLAPNLGGSPDSCDVYASEPWQCAPAIGVDGGTVGVLSLHSDAGLVPITGPAAPPADEASASADRTQDRTALPARSVLLLRPSAQPSAPTRYRLAGTGARHVAVIFRLCPKPT